MGAGVVIGLSWGLAGDDGAPCRAGVCKPGAKPHQSRANPDEIGDETACWTGIGGVSGGLIVEVRTAPD
jgi:hypothetical protein